MKNIKRVTLEISLKPFKSTDSEEIEKVCEKAFLQWKNLLCEADEIGIMLWASDGSEILDYGGSLLDKFEWARLIGGANVKMNWDKKNDPEGLGLHTRCYDYTENPPEYTYGDLKTIVNILKSTGKRITGKPVFIGATFDPGPEFARSDFKYKYHNEICEGASMGKKSMVCCYYTLNADSRHYAAYPNGIPQNTPFGTFFGKQAQRFLSDLDFDYIWLSNGFGFGTETWGVSGALFDGKRFYPEKLDNTRKNIERFWELFTAECTYPIQTRGTNLTVGTDFASDGVDHSMIYSKNPTLLPPPNSPWAALDGNFGLELAGYMSRAAELPDEDFIFRFYVHDPWWLNSPWIDRYEGQPHDIFLPTATARIDKNGDTRVANHINFLSIDNSYGDMPERCPNEIIPFILSSYENAPDEPSPFIWVYPFREYSTLACGRLEKPFYDDWYFTAALNHGFPINTVISTDNFAKLYSEKPNLFHGKVLVSPIPEENSVICDSITHFAKNGGNVIFYGSLKGIDSRILSLLNLTHEHELCGEFSVTDYTGIENELQKGSLSRTINYGGIYTDGGISAIVKTPSPDTEILAEAENSDGKRVIALSNKVGSGKALWCRGCDCSRKPVDADDATKKDDTVHYDSFPAEILMRKMCHFVGYDFSFSKYDKYTKEPVILMHRSHSSLWFEGYCPDTTVKIGLCTPIGAPLLLANETVINDGCTEYHMPRAWRHECRVFVENHEGGVIHAKETIPTAYGVERRILVENLKNATVYVIPKKGNPEKTFFMLNSEYPHFVSQPFTCELTESPFGKVYKLCNISGNLLISDNI